MTKWFVRREGVDIEIVSLGSSLSLELSGYCFNILTNSGTELTEELWFYYGQELGTYHGCTHTLTKSAIDATRPTPVTPEE